MEYKVNTDIEIQTVMCDSYWGEHRSKREIIKEGTKFSEDNILTRDEFRYEVKWGAGDVSYIPTLSVDLVE